MFIGGLLGSMLIFLFSAWACSAVGRTAQEVVNEVRRQFIERPGIMVGVVHRLLMFHLWYRFLFLFFILMWNRTTRRNQIMEDVYPLLHQHL